MYNEPDERLLKKNLNQELDDTDPDFLNEFEKTFEINRIPIEEKINNDIKSLYYDTELPGELHQTNPNELSFPPYPSPKERGR